MAKIFVLFLLLFLLTGTAVAATDFKCMNNCTSQGYLYNYCLSQCSYDNSPQTYQPQTNQQQPQLQRVPQTDFKCVSDCTSKGYQYGYCKDRCSY